MDSTEVLWSKAKLVIGVIGGEVMWIEEIQFLVDCCAFTARRQSLRGKCEHELVREWSGRTESSKFALDVRDGENGHVIA
jgi:hypothetical protein